MAALTPAQAWVERVPQPITDVIHAQHGQRDKEPGPDDPGGRDLYEVSAVIKQPTPGWEIRWESQPQKGQGRLGDDGIRNTRAWPTP